MPPSPLHMAVLAMAEPLDRATFTSLDKAPKDIWEMYTGFSSTMGFWACLPMTVVVSTGSPSFRGAGFSWAPSSRISSQLGMGIRVPMEPPMDFPVTAISWISAM